VQAFLTRRQATRFGRVQACGIAAVKMTGAQWMGLANQISVSVLASMIEGSTLPRHAAKKCQGGRMRGPDHAREATSSICNPQTELPPRHNRRSRCVGLSFATLLLH